MNNKIILFGVIVLLLGGVAYYAANNAWLMDAERDRVAMAGHHGDDSTESYEIYPGDVAAMMEQREDVVLLDVRTLEEYEAMHLRGARLLPVQQLSAETLSEIGLGEDAKDKEIIIYCRSGARSQTAYNIMTSLGYTNLKSIAGGMIHWEEDNYPFVESGAYEGHTMMSDDVANTDDASGPQITLDRTTHDFGVIPQYGGVVEADFDITNTGTEILEIGDITTSCSCTSASVADATVAPNEQTTLTVVFDPDFHEEPRGVFKRTVFIPTNDPTNEEAEVTITVDIAEGQ